MTAPRCRHNRFWVIAGGYWLWCYECGAVRKMRITDDGTVTSDWKRWQKPVGKLGENPWTYEMNK